MFEKNLHPALKQLSRFWYSPQTSLPAGVSNEPRAIRLPSYTRLRSEPRNQAQTFHHLLTYSHKMEIHQFYFISKRITCNRSLRNGNDVERPRKRGSHGLFRVLWAKESRQVTKTSRLVPTDFCLKSSDSRFLIHIAHVVMYSSF